MFPIATIGRTKYRPYTTFFLMVANVLVFLLLELPVMARGDAATSDFFHTYALGICNIGHESVLTSLRNGFFSMFLHIGFMHLFANMVFLWVFGPIVESYYGRRRFLTFYILAGFAATIAHALLGSALCDIGDTPGIVMGASGAVAGVMGAFLFIKPAGKVRTAVVVGRIPFGLVDVSAWIFFAIWLLVDFVQIITPAETGVAHWAHIGGFVAGFAMTFLAGMFKPVPESRLFAEE